MLFCLATCTWDEAAVPSPLCLWSPRRTSWSRAGPYGLEELVGKAGYRRTFLILLLTPLLWSIPTTLMEAELSSSLPEEGGYYVWVRRALGPFWGILWRLADAYGQHL